MFRPGMEQLPQYFTGEAMGVDQVCFCKLDANERPGQLPASVRREILAQLKLVESTRYPDPSGANLRKLLADEYQVTANQVLIGNGSSELIAAVCATFGGARRPVVYQWPSFSMYPVYAAMADSPPVAAPLTKYFELLPAAILARVRQVRAKLLILCNPNNPTGTVIPPASLRNILEQCPCPVLVDEAYMEFYGTSCTPWLAEFPQLMVARTFSKAYGLAAARVGYLLASPEICAAVGKRLLPYHNNAFSLTAAEACFRQRDLVLKAIPELIGRREELAGAIDKLAAIEVFPSAANFLLIRVGKPELLQDILTYNHIGVRDFSSMPELKGCLRITIGTRSEQTKVLQGLRVYNGSVTRREPEPCATRIQRRPGKDL